MAALVTWPRTGMTYSGFAQPSFPRSLMEGSPLTQEHRSTLPLSRRIDAPLMLMLCFPLVPHHPTVIEYSIETMLVPLAYSPISIALALTLLLVLGERPAPRSTRVSLLTAGSALVLIGCDAAYAAWRLGLRTPLPKAAVEPVDVLAQSLFLTAGFLLTRLSPTGAETQSAHKGTRAIGASSSFLFGALFPRLLSLLAIASSRYIAGQVSVCLLSGALGSRLLASRRTETSADEPLSAQASLLLGLLFSSAFDELTLSALCSARLNINSQDPTAVRAAAIWCAIALAGYVLLVLLFGLLLHRLSQRRSSSLGETSTKDPTRIRRLDSLSPRQQQVLLMSIQGSSDADIAQTLGLTPGTVGNHRRRGLERLGISEIGELIVAEDDAEGPMKPGKRPVPVAAKCILGFAGAAALCCSTLLRPPSDIAYFLSVLIGIALAASCMVAFLSRTRHKTVDQDHANPSATALVSFFWFVLSAATTLCWAFASLVTTLVISGALIAWVYIRVLGPKVGSAHTKAPHAPQADKSKARFVDGAEPSLALASTAAGIILAAHASQSLGMLSSEASRCHLAARILLGVAVVMMFTLSVISRRASEEKDSRADGASAPDVFCQSMGLSELEAQIAALSARGYTRPQICEMLHIAAGTVNSCRAAAYRKLGVHSKEELTALLNECTGQSRR